VTLRARLTAAFLTVVLGPVLLGAIFVGGTVAAVTRDRAAARLDLATTAVRTSVNALCGRLRAAATTAALLNVAGRGPESAVANRLATTVVIASADGDTTAVAGPPPPARWADCAGTGPSEPLGIGVRIEIRDRDGTLRGYAVAIESLDGDLVRALSRASGASVGLAPEKSTPGEARRTLDPEPGQPLPLALSVTQEPLSRLYAGLVLVVALAGAAAVLVAWWLARTTARPLSELSEAVERVAAGDFHTRVPVRSGDEVGRLAETFNRMTREMRGYVRALTASRDQLRGHLALLGETLSSTHDLPRILEVILSSARAATGAQAGVIMLFDPTSRMLVAQCAEGSADLADLRLRPGDGLLGAVAVSGVPRKGRNAPRPAGPEPACRSYIAVPFAAPAHAEDPDTARGVLALYDRHGAEEFDDTDVVMLQRFATQAAVALDNVRVHEQAQRLSLTDPLTGLFNYRYLTESLRREVERAARFGRTLSVLALDLDHFKDVNDRFGHAAGDVVLAEFARRVRGLIREVDFAFRRGGEEFVILLPETDASGASSLARRLGAGLRRVPVAVGGDLLVPVTVSMGIAVYPGHGWTGPEVLDAADTALYAAKASGRDTYRVAGVPAGASGGAKPPRQSRGG